MDTLPIYQPKGKHVEMLNCGVPLQPRNLLDNSDFTNPVNQRGQTSYTSSGYSIDRWRADGDGSATLSSSGITVSDKSFRQFVKLPAGTYTLAFKISNGVLLTISFTYDGTSTLSTIIGNNASTIGAYINYYNYSSGVVACQFVLGSDYTYTLVWAALYEGAYDASTLPAYQPKGYGAELAECKRYFQTRDISNYKVVVLGEELYFAIEHSDMRIAPSITIINPIANENNSIANLASGGKFATEIRTITKDRSIIYVATGTSGKSYAVSYTASADL